MQYFKEKNWYYFDEDNTSINDWLDDQNGDIILKMDIEGDEYLTYPQFQIKI